jgi:hypothetical protein
VSGTGGTGRTETPPFEEEASAAGGFRYEDYWNAFREALLRAGSRLRPPTVRATNWVRFPAGGSGAWLAGVVSVRNRFLGVELILDRPQGALAYKVLMVERAEIEAELGEALQWRELGGSYRIELHSDGFDPAQRDDWKRQHVWLLDNLEKFQRVLVPRIQRIHYSEIRSDLTPE